MLKERRNGTNYAYIFEVVGYFCVKGIQQDLVAGQMPDLSHGYHTVTQSTKHVLQPGSTQITLKCLTIVMGTTQSRRAPNMYCSQEVHQSH